MIASEVEITPGEIWESVHGKHVGLRVAVLSDRGNSVKVKVIRNQGASGANKMIGQIWSVDRQVFVARYREVKGMTVVSEKPRVETDLNALLKAMPPAPPMPAPANGRVENATHTLQRPEVRAKRNATMAARVAGLTPTQVEEIVQLFETGTPVGEIARAYRLGTSDANRIVADYRRQQATLDAVLNPAPAPEPTREQKIGEGVKGGIDRQFAGLSNATKFIICQERLSGATYWGLLRKYKLINGVLSRVLKEGGVPVGLAGRLLSKTTIDDHRASGSPTPVVPEISQPITISQSIADDIERQGEAMLKKHTADQPKLYMAKVYVMEPVLKEVEVEANDFVEAVELAKAIPFVTRVAGVWEAY